MRSCSYPNLELIEYKFRDIMIKKFTEEIIPKLNASEPKVWVFRQLWGSTALGFSGIGGCAMTYAYTTVIELCGVYGVYFGGHFAYVVDEPTEQFFEDLKNCEMKSCRDAKFYYNKYEKED